jgi:hypothetical protein
MYKTNRDVSGNRMRYVRVRASARDTSRRTWPTRASALPRQTPS